MSVKPGIGPENPRNTPHPPKNTVGTPRDTPWPAATRRNLPDTLKYKNNAEKSQTSKSVINESVNMFNL